MGAAFCRFEVLFVAHRLYMAAMAAGAVGLYFTFLRCPNLREAIVCGVAPMRRPPYLVSPDTELISMVSPAAGLAVSTRRRNVSSSGRYCKRLRSFIGAVLHAGYRRPGLGRET